MKFHRANNLRYCSDSDRDLDCVRAAAELVLARYTGGGYRWKLAKSDQLWKIFLGNRAGVVGIRQNDRVCCVKLFYDARLQTKVRVALGFAKARRAYRNGLRLQQAGVNCPQMLGCAEQRPGGPALLVTELIDDGLRLDHWIARHGVPRQAILDLARYIRNMHDRGVFHVDLSHRNLLIRQRESHFDFLLLDYEDARFVGHLSRRRRLDNLHHLHERMAQHVPLRKRLRFLRAYAGEDYGVYRDILKQMMKKSMKTAHKSRYLRPLTEEAGESR